MPKKRDESLIGSVFSYLTQAYRKCIIMKTTETRQPLIFYVLRGLRWKN